MNAFNNLANITLPKWLT
uniref:Uncharacterized protein n=1 Tax=Anguilla anguilla TaxID=7936 RepID=A0A0E9V1I4_ANGAN